jgi:hypothetical protein
MAAIGTAAYLTTAVWPGAAGATASSGFHSTTKGPYGFVPFNLHASNDAGWTAKLQTHGLTDAYFTDNTIDPGGTSGWHSHPGPSLIYVVSGSVTNYQLNGDGTCTVTTYPAGTGFVDAGTSPHMVRNETSQPAEDYAIQLLPKGSVRKNDQPAPGSCTF